MIFATKPSESSSSRGSCRGPGTKSQKRRNSKQISRKSKRSAKILFAFTSSEVPIRLALIYSSSQRQVSLGVASLAVSDGAALDPSKKAPKKLKHKDQDSKSVHFLAGHALALVSMMSCSRTHNPPP
eukprot:m.109393 g.109393  ORF g.109393 m.109393 type:complete len:127 (-) comp51764_c0_seq3:444-824(-)